MSDYVSSSDPRMDRESERASDALTTESRYTQEVPLPSQPDPVTDAVGGASGAGGAGGGGTSAGGPKAPVIPSPVISSTATGEGGNPFGTILIALGVGVLAIFLWHKLHGKKGHHEQSEE